MPRTTLFVTACLAATATVTATGVSVDTSLPRRMIDGDEYTATPNGYVLSHCVYEVPHEAQSVKDEVGRCLCVGGWYFRFDPSVLLIVNISTVGHQRTARFRLRRHIAPLRAALRTTQQQTQRICRSCL